MAPCPAYIPPPNPVVPEQVRRGRVSAVRRDGVSRGGERRPLWWLVVVALGVVVVDQVTKVLAVEHLTGAGYVPLLGEYLGLKLIYNPGAAFGMASGMTWVLALITVGVIVAIVRLARSLSSRVWGATLGLLLGGAVGNLIDRLVRAPGVLRGHVVDFLSYWDWFVGNVADIAIVVAAVGMVVLTLRGEDPQPPKEGADEVGPPETKSPDANLPGTEPTDTEPAEPAELGGTDA